MHTKHTLLLLACCAQSAQALTTTDLTQGVSAVDLANKLSANGGMTISAVTYQGSNSAAGLFDSAVGLGLSSGVILSSGNIADATGTNNSTGSSTAHGTPGDADLDALSGAQTQDAAVLSFDFVPQGNTLTLNYIFASEEYPEFNNSSFTDAVAIFVDGKNIALIPSTSDAVASNRINNSQNSTLYRDNGLPASSYNISFDGFTQMFTAQTAVTPGQTHRLKLAVADVNDANFDSALLFQAGSLRAPAAQIHTGTPESIPTLSHWALIALSGLLAGVAARRLRR
jgi:hypothetical protein